MDCMPFKHVQQQRRSSTGRRRLLFTSLITHCNAQITERSTGDDNHSTNILCDMGSLDDNGKSVGASRCSFESELEDGFTPICTSVDQSGVTSPFGMKRAGMFRQQLILDHAQCDGLSTPLICSPHNGDANSATCEEVAAGSWFPGQLVWAKLSDFPWWPAQVMDERCVNDGLRPPQLLKNDVLVRFFGVYNLAWVNPLTNISEFDLNFEERSQILLKTFQRGLKEALEYRDSRRLPSSWKISIQTRSAEEFELKPRKCLEFSEDSNSHDQVNMKALHSNGHEHAKFDGLHEACLTRKRKPKMLYEEEERLHRKPDRKVRRRRIMRDLGLAAPYGSPFTLNNLSRTM